MIVEHLDTPNQSARIHGNDGVRLIVCHTPEGTYEGTKATIMNPAAKVSYHFLINKEGTKAVQFVDWTRKAWHAKVYNSVSDGISVCDFARLFDLSQPGVGVMAKTVAQRLIARNLPCVWTTDVAKGGFCRHADLQSDRSDPTPDIVEWKLFCAIVSVEYEKLKKPPAPVWPVPVPAWFWTWARWRLGVAEFKPFGPANPKHRPGAPVPGPGVSWAPGGKNYWAWKRLKALQDATKSKEEV